MGLRFNPFTGKFDLVRSTIPADKVTIEKLGDPTYQTQQALIATQCSGGVVSGGTITDAGSSLIDVSSGQIYIRPSDSDVATLYAGEFSAQSGLSLTADSQNYIYVEYNSGSPQVSIDTSVRLDNHSNVLLGAVYNDGTDLHITNFETRPQQLSQNLGKRLALVDGITRQAGSVTSETGTRNIAVTQGLWWLGLTEYILTAIDTSIASTFSYYYQDGLGGFTEVSGQTQIDNTQYDDGTGTLATLTNNKYGVHWVYRGLDNDTYVLYGTGDYLLKELDAVAVPSSTPGHLTSIHAALVARIVIQKGATTFTSIQAPFDVTFTSGEPTSHLDLTEIGTNTHAQIDSHIALRTTKGDLVSYSTTPERLPVGTDGQVLTADSTESTGLKWAASTFVGVPYKITTNITISEFNEYHLEASNLIISGGDITLIGILAI